MLNSVSNRKLPSHASNPSPNLLASTGHKSNRGSPTLSESERSLLRSRASSSASADDDIETMFDQMDDENLQRTHPVETADSDVADKQENRRIMIRRGFGAFAFCVILNVICTIVMIGGPSELRRLLDPSLQPPWEWPPENSAELHDKTVFITGASRGFGKALTLQFASFGSHVILHCRTKESCTDTVTSLHTDHGVTVSACFAADLTDPDAISDLAFQLEQSKVVLDIVVLNAAIADSVATKLSTGLNRMFMVNYLANVVLVEQLVLNNVLPLHSKDKHGPRPRIVIIGSGEYVHGATRDFGAITDWSSNQAIGRHGQTKFLLMTWGSYFSQVNEGVDVVTHSPGPVLTDLGRDNVPTLLLPVYMLIKYSLFQSPEIASRPTVSLAIPSGMKRNTFLSVRQIRMDELTEKSHNTKTHTWLLKNTISALRMCHYHIVPNFNYTNMGLDDVNNPYPELEEAAHIPVRARHDERQVTEHEREQQQNHHHQGVDAPGPTANGETGNTALHGNTQENFSLDDEMDGESDGKDNNDESNLLTTQFKMDEEEEEEEQLLQEKQEKQVEEKVEYQAPKQQNNHEQEQEQEQDHQQQDHEQQEQQQQQQGHDHQQHEHEQEQAHENEQQLVEHEVRLGEHQPEVVTLTPEAGTHEPNIARNNTELDQWGTVEVDSTYRPFSTLGNICIDTMGSLSSRPVGIYKCHGLGGNQALSYTSNSELRTASNLCLDSSGSLPSVVTVYDCHGLKGNQAWRLTRSGKLVHSKDRVFDDGTVSAACLDVVDNQLRVTKCFEGAKAQIWDFGFDKRDEL